MSIFKGGYGMQSTLQILSPLIFLVLFLAVGGGALYLTPRIAKWLDKREKKSKGYYDDMMETTPEEKGGEKEDPCSK